MSSSMCSFSDGIFLMQMSGRLGTEAVFFSNRITKMRLFMHECNITVPEKLTVN